MLFDNRLSFISRAGSSGKGFGVWNRSGKRVFPISDNLMALSLCFALTLSMEPRGRKINFPSSHSGFSLNLCNSAYLIPVRRREVHILLVSGSNAFLMVSNSIGLRILTWNFSEDLTMDLNVPVKLPSKLNALHWFFVYGNMDLVQQYINSVKF